MSAVRIRSPHPRLRAHLGVCLGYEISGVPAGTHLGLPSGALTFIVGIGDPVRLHDPAEGRDADFDVLLAGLHLSPTLVRHEGAMTGLQIALSPFAARALFGLSAAELAHESVDLREVVRPLGAELHERINAADGWAARFDVIDEVLLSALREDAVPRPEIAHAWDAILGSRGGLSIAAIAEEVGWSRRHLSAQLRAEVGIGPKDAARIVRFDRARRMIAAAVSEPTGDAVAQARWAESDGPAGPGSGAGHRATLAEIAAVCGYADHSHLIRDFTDFAGASPTAWLRADPLVAAR